MRAAIVERIGSPPRPGEVPEPTPRTGEALVEVLAAPVRPLDYRIAAGSVEGGPPDTPYVVGAEGIGRVLSGDELPSGTLVWFQLAGGTGALAERVAAPEPRLVRLPPGADVIFAAAFGGAGTVAGLALEWRAGLRFGESVLLVGLPGILGQVTLQAAKILGAGRVVVASHHEDDLLLATQLGADATLAELGELEGTSFDVVIDGAWGVSANAGLSLLRPDGRLVNVGAESPRADLSSVLLRARNLTVFGLSNVATPTDLRATSFTKLLSAATDGRLRLEYDVCRLTEGEEEWARGPWGRPLVISLANGERLIGGQPAAP